MKKLILFVAALVCCMIGAMAQEVTWDFAAKVSSGQTLYFDITDDVNLYCEVVSGLARPEGEVVIDAQVVSNMDDKTYTVQGIADNAFYEAKSMTKITFPTAATFTYIGKTEEYCHAIRNCGITELVIPDNVTFIGGTAFDSDAITSLTLGSGVSTLNYATFYNTDLTHVVLPNTLKFIKSQVFSGNKKLTYIELGNAVEQFYASSIDYCDKLDTVVVNTVTPPEVPSPFAGSLTQRAFLFVPAGAVEDYKAHKNWGAFKHIFAIGTEVKLLKLDFNLHIDYSVNDNCFVYADDEYVKTGSSINLISGETTHLRFEPQQYWALEKLLLNGTDITAQVKENKVDVTITEDATLETKWYQPKTPYDFTEVVASRQTLYFAITDAVNHKVKIVNQSGGRNYAGHQHYAYIEKNGEGVWDLSTDLRPKGDLVIPATIEHDGQTYTVTAIDTLAFGGCNQITSLSVPEGITAIYAAAFMACTALKGKLVLPSSCSVLGAWAFRECALSGIDFGGVTSLEEHVLLSNNNIKEVVTGPAMKMFNTDCLRSMYYLESVVIGENVEFVSSSSFYGDNNLKTVKILATTPPVVKWATESPEASEWYGYNPSQSGIDAKLIVPWSADHSVLNAYKNAACWKQFGTIEEKSTATGIEGVQVTENNAQKILRNGQLLILRDGKTYTVTGAVMER